jgi:hypothetical protein
VTVLLGPSSLAMSRTGCRLRWKCDGRLDLQQHCNCDYFSDVVVCLVAVCVRACVVCVLQVENLKHSEHAALARASERSRAQQLDAEKQFVFFVLLNCEALTA